MDEREILQKAQEAEAMANTVMDARVRQQWEIIAQEWRKVLKIATSKRLLKDS